MLLQLFQQIQTMSSFGFNQESGNSNNKNEITLIQLVNVFRGSKSQYNRNRGYTEAENFGAGKSMYSSSVTRLAEHLQTSGYLQQYTRTSSAGYTVNYVELGAKAHGLLSGQGVVLLREVKDTQVRRKKMEMGANKIRFDLYTYLMLLLLMLLLFCFLLVPCIVIIKIIGCIYEWQQYQCKQAPATTTK
jgi:superfamily II DNA helicase RecQ